MFALLMKIRLLSGWNVTRDTARGHPLLVVGLSVLGITLFVGMVFGFLIFFDFAARLGVLAETIYQIFYFLFLFLLAPKSGQETRDELGKAMNDLSDKISEISHTVGQKVTTAVDKTRANITQKLGEVPPEGEEAVS